MDSQPPEKGYTVQWRVEQLAKTIAEQLTGITQQLDKIERKIDRKAESTYVRELETRIRGLEERCGDLELSQASRVAVGKATMWAISTIGVSVFVAAVGLLAAAISGGRL